MTRLATFSLWSLLICTVTKAQLQYLTEPTLRWNISVPDLGEGNGAIVSPDGLILYVTSHDGTLSALDPENGSEIYSYRPELLGMEFTFTSTVTFHPPPPFGKHREKIFYIVSGVADDTIASPFSRVVALSHPGGEEILVSDPIEGEASGNALVSSDGSFVYVLSNSKGGNYTYGQFSVIALNRGSVVFSHVDTINPYSPAAIFHSPSYGNYNGGLDNDQDIIVWSYTEVSGSSEIGPGNTFLFQLPESFNDTANLVVVDMGEKNWQSNAAPAITNNGKSLHFTVSRNELRGWNGNKFDRGAKVKFFGETPDPAHLAGYNTPVFKSDGSICYVGMANLSMAAFSNSLSPLWMVPTSSPVQSEVVLSLNEEIVFWTEFTGFSLLLTLPRERSSGGLVWTAIVLQSFPSILTGRLFIWETQRETLLV